jgi:hypothetical protein
VNGNGGASLSNTSFLKNDYPAIPEKIYPPPEKGKEYAKLEKKWWTN